MAWSIEYFNERLQQAVLDLPKGLLARYFRLTDIMEKYGAHRLGMPDSRHMGDGLLELRLKAKEGIARVFYCTVVNNRIVILHVFQKKSVKTPKKELDIARKRLKEVKNAKS